MKPASLKYLSIFSTLFLLMMFILSTKSFCQKKYTVSYTFSNKDTSNIFHFTDLKAEFDSKENARKYIIALSQTLFNKGFAAASVDSVFFDSTHARISVYLGNRYQWAEISTDSIDENVVIIDTVSKRYSACGARLGCLITKNKEVIATGLKFAQARLSAGMVEQIAGTAAIDTPDSYFEAVNKEYTHRRNTLVNALNKMDGVYCPNPGGAFYVVARLPIDDSDKFCQWMLESFSHDNQTVMIAPATGFYSTPGAGINEVRMAYVLNSIDLHNAMVCLEKALKVYPGRVETVGSYPFAVGK